MIMENTGLITQVKEAMEKRVQLLMVNDPEFQRLRGMLDVLEGRLTPNNEEQDEVQNTEVFKDEDS